MRKPGRTILWNLKPDTVIREGLLIVVEAFLTALALSIIPVHRRVLLMAEDDSFAGTTFSGRFAALAALGLLFVALELPCTTGQAVINPICQQDLSMRLG